MRHGKKFNHLSRTHEHRAAMLSNMATSLIMHKRIKTTVAKAKALQLYIDPLLTKSKSDTTHSRRIVFKYLQNKFAVTELFREVSVKIADRPGGYTRIIKIGQRLGDSAEMCYIELVDFNENLLSTKKSSAAKKPTVRRSRKKSTTTTPTNITENDGEQTTKTPENKIVEEANETSPEKTNKNSEETDNTSVENTDTNK
ncbi:MAG: 50S ribosomal protein L17 [Bacteroidales bacterium]|nr:50S ribosomal protein L17 [Bacteroidales bacterium]NLK81068.1 50S ribosomal protein L17 [Bacteroidales bacterium]